MVALSLIVCTGVSSSGAGFFAHQSEDCWRGRRWGHVDGIRADDDVLSCRAFVLFPCSLLMRFTWVLTILGWFGMLVGCLVVLMVPLHLRWSMTVSFLLVQRMLHLRGLDTVRIAKVKGHADDAMVLDGSGSGG